MAAFTLDDVRGVFANHSGELSTREVLLALDKGATVEWDKDKGGLQQRMPEVRSLLMQLMELGEFKRDIRRGKTFLKQLDCDLWYWTKV